MPKSAIEEAEQRDKGDTDLASLGVSREHVRKSNSLRRIDHGQTAKQQNGKSIGNNAETDKLGPGPQHGSAQHGSAQHDSALQGSALYDSAQHDLRSSLQHPLTSAQSSQGNKASPRAGVSHPHSDPEHPQDGSGHLQGTGGHPQNAPGHLQGMEGLSQDDPGPLQSMEGPSQHQQRGHSLRQSVDSRRSRDSRRSLESRRSMEKQSAGMSLPFEQLNFVFHHIYYSVPATVSYMPEHSTKHVCIAL